MAQNPFHRPRFFKGIVRLWITMWDQSQNDQTPDLSVKLFFHLIEVSLLLHVIESLSS